MPHLFPIQELVKTVEGEGPRSGEVIILLRFGLHRALKGLHVTPKPLKTTEAKYLSAGAILEAAQELGPKFVHIGGEDPMLCAGFDTLIDMLTDAGFEVMVDTFGYRDFDGPKPDAVFLSICPRPELPCTMQMLSSADEVRLYLSVDAPEVWDTLTESIIALYHAAQRTYPVPRISIMPREMTDACITNVLTFCLLEKRVPVFAAIPLYRLFPAIDSVAVWSSVMQ